MLCGNWFASRSMEVSETSRPSPGFQPRPSLPGLGCCFLTYPGLRRTAGAARLHPGLFSRRASTASRVGYGACVDGAAMLAFCAAVRMVPNAYSTGPVERHQSGHAMIFQNEPSCADVDVPTTAGQETGATRAPARLVPISRLTETIPSLLSSGQP